MFDVFNTLSARHTLERVRAELCAPSPEPCGALLHGGFHIGTLLHSQLQRLAVVLDKAHLPCDWTDEGLHLKGPWQALINALCPRAEEDPELIAVEQTPFCLPRSLCRTLGVHTRVVRLVIADQEHLVCAQRALTRHINPGLLDNPVAGMVKAHESLTEALEREALEEASLALLADSPLLQFETARALDDGFLRETTYVWWRTLSQISSVTLVANDGEVACFQALTPQQYLNALACKRIVPEAAMATLLATQHTI